MELSDKKGSRFSFGNYNFPVVLKILEVLSIDVEFFFYHFNFFGGGQLLLH